jgi:hypothetical protein
MGWKKEKIVEGLYYFDKGFRGNQFHQTSFNKLNSQFVMVNEGYRGIMRDCGNDVGYCSSWYGFYIGFVGNVLQRRSVK